MAKIKGYCYCGSQSQEEHVAVHVEQVNVGFRVYNLDSGSRQSDAQVSPGMTIESINLKSL